MAPDVAVIVEVLLFTFGFSTAPDLAKKVTKLYEMAAVQLSQQVVGVTCYNMYTACPSTSSDVHVLCVCCAEALRLWLESSEGFCAACWGLLEERQELVSIPITAIPYSPVV